MYELERVRKVFDGDLAAVSDVSFTVGDGEHVAFIGPSGAGKTTLFRILNLTLRPTSGVLRLDGVDIGTFGGEALRGLRRRIGTVYQQHNLVGRLRAIHNVLAGHLGRWSTAKALLSLVCPQESETAARALAQVGIPEKLYARTDTLSGGQQQRVAIARVLVQDPRVILADEPVSSVDPSLAASLVRLLKDLSLGSGKTLLMNLHSVDLALAFFPRIIGIRHGRVLFDLASDKVNDDLLAALYAGHTSEEEATACPDVVLPTGPLCRPVPGLK